MKKSQLVIAVASSVLLIGCTSGSDDVNTSKIRDDAQGKNNIVKQLDAVHFTRFLEYEDTRCIQLEDNQSVIIEWFATSVSKNITLKVSEFNNGTCMGIDKFLYVASYSYKLGEVASDLRSAEVQIKYETGSDVTQLIPQNIFGNNLNIFYTTIRATGNGYLTSDLKVNIAIPTESNNGESAETRAIEKSPYSFVQ